MPDGEMAAGAFDIAVCKGIDVGEQERCHLLVGLDAAGTLPVYNYIQLVSQSMGLPYEDEYKEWKRAPDAAKEIIGAERIAKVGVEFYERAILPELKKRPALNK